MEYTKAIDKARERAKQKEEEYIVYWDETGLEPDGPKTWGVIPLHDYYADLYGILEHEVAFITPDEYYQSSGVR